MHVESDDVGTGVTSGSLIQLVVIKNMVFEEVAKVIATKFDVNGQIVVP